MGIEIASRSFPDDLEEPISEQQLQYMLSQLKRLSGRDLKRYFETLFKEMNPSSKEAMTEIMWASLSTREQHMFEMPVFGNQENDLTGRLDRAFSTLQIGDHIEHYQSLPLQTPSPRVHVGRSREVMTRELRGRPGREVEEQIFSVLMEAILRAEQRENRQDQGQQTQREE